MKQINLTKYTMFNSLMEECNDIPTAGDIEFRRKILEELD